MLADNRRSTLLWSGLNTVSIYSPLADLRLAAPGREDIFSISQGNRGEGVDDDERV